MLIGLYYGFHIFSSCILLLESLKQLPLILATLTHGTYRNRFRFLSIPSIQDIIFHFSKKNFLDCMGTKRTRDFLKWLDAQDLYIHYFNINNLYYAIVELFDSVTDQRELTELDFNYFNMKSILYETILIMF